MRRVCKTSRFESYARELGPIFCELIAAGVDSPKRIAAEFTRRGIPRLNKSKWCGRSVVRAIRRAAPEFVEVVRRAGRRYKPGNLERAWRITRQRSATHMTNLKPMLVELIAAGVCHPHAIAHELNLRDVRGVNGAKWSTSSVMRAIRRTAPELAEKLDRKPWREDAVVRAKLELGRQVALERANSFAAGMSPVMRELIAKGFTPDLVAGELNQRGMRGRYGKRWRGSTVRRVLQRVDPELYAGWSTWCAGRIVRRDLRGDRERVRSILKRLRQQASAYRRDFVRIVKPLIGAGHDTAAKLVLELARLGVPTARGGRWRPETVLKMLQREEPRLYRMIRPCSPRERSERFAAQLRPLIGDLVAQGITRPSAIAAELDRRKVPTKRGGPNWHPNSVRALLRRFGHLHPPKRRYRPLRASDVARQLGVTEDDVYAAVRRGELVGVGVGRRISFPPDTIERALYARARASRRGNL